jgi:hypothetical protein
MALPVMAGQKKTARMTALMAKKAIQGHAMRGGRVTSGRGNVSGDTDIGFWFSFVALSEPA